ncbi:hypothetical protein [Massilia pseudoviolaceinigra]|uniref:hypothetical protein n=1 Tax=Massilia pseudoviolaceinigra TaxID=3057165 RepID=UPI002796CBAF|nr:hypothetical protein [Massilia sp. CCM 9206]MDQ1923085.1 hypothetical protein [Massilia sp. CCM 9206]
MENHIEIEKQMVLEALTELNWLDTKLFRLGTALAASNSSQQEIAASLLDFFIENDVGNKIAKIKNSLREAIEADLDYDESGISELERMYEHRLAQPSPTLSEPKPGEP